MPEQASDKVNNTIETAAESIPDTVVGGISEAAEKVEGVIKEKPALIEIEAKIDIQEHAETIIETTQSILSTDYIWQLGVILCCLILAYGFAQRLRASFIAHVEGLDFKATRKIGQTLIDGIPKVVLPAVMSFFFYVAAKGFQFYELKNNALMIASSLSFAWLAVSYISSFIHSQMLRKWVATLVLVVLCLRIVGWWDGTVTMLESVQFGLNANRISLMAIIKGVLYFLFFLWLARVVSSAGEKQIKSLDDLTPSLKVLFSKLLKISLIFFAVLLGLNAVGVDLSSFAIFGGAIGVGLGFGLQKVVSNFISGIILLLDRSIKPGDVIAVGTGADATFGWVNTLGARYVSVIRRDGKEHLIPNELLITEKVENWSFSNNDIRLSIPVGVSYDADVRLAMELCLKAAQEEPRVKKFPEPVIRVLGFGDSSVDLEVRGWINDPVNGVGNIRSDILLSIWDKFHEHDIEIPYPQRDLHVRSMPDQIMDKMKDDLRKEILAELKAADKKSAKKTSATKTAKKD